MAAEVIVGSPQKFNGVHILLRFPDVVKDALKVKVLVIVTSQNLSSGTLNTAKTEAVATTSTVFGLTKPGIKPITCESMGGHSATGPVRW